MTMTLGQVRDRLREMPGMDRIDAIDIHEMAGAIGSHLTQPAQSVNVENLQEVVAAHVRDLRECVIVLSEYPQFSEVSLEIAKAADELTAALQEKGNG